MIEFGACCALLAEEIVLNRRNVTLVTNSVFIVTFLRDKLGARIILLGGEFQQESQVTVDPLIKGCAQNFRVEKFFIGTDGLKEAGAMSNDLMRSETVRNMGQSAQKSIILIESKKFSQIGVVSLLSYAEISEIYTDDEIPHETKQALEEKSLRCIKQRVQRFLFLYYERSFFPKVSQVYA